MSKEENGTELLETGEDGNKEQPKGQPPKTTALVLMIIILVAITLIGGYYTYYQYKRMEEANSKAK